MERMDGVSTNEVVNEYDTSRRLREKRRQRKRRTMMILTGIGCAILFIALMVGSVALYLRLDKSMQEDAKEATNMSVESVEESITGYSEEELKAYIEQVKAEAKAQGAQEVLDTLAIGINSDASMVEILRNLYTDRLVVASNGAYHFMPLNPQLKMHSYVNDNLLLLENGTVEYMEDGKVISYKGIDVSKHQGEIDWEKVAADGVKFAFIRVGNRGYGSGAIVEDTQFEANIKGAISNGIQVGVYFFSQAITQEEAREEAAFVLEKIAPYKVQCPVVLDVEKVADSEARMNKISKEERTANTKVFLETVEAAGYDVMLYHNMEMGLLMIDLEEFEEYDKWFAYYNKEIYYPYEFTVWQYSDKGKVNGIAGDVDLNISFKLWD